MEFNKSALAFMKETKGMTPDEKFLYGFLIGNESGMMTALSSDYGDRGAEEIVRTVYTNQVRLDLWDQMAVSMELEVRSLAEINPNFC